MSCLGDCWDLGPPPDSILFLPPPPIPSFLQPSLNDQLLNTTPCSFNQLCESWLPSSRTPEGGITGGGGEYVEMPRKVSSIDDTWLLVLVASSIGVLLLGALLAMFLLKCREMNLFGSDDCSMHVRDRHHHNIKTEPRDCSNSLITSTKLVHTPDAGSMFTRNGSLHGGGGDNRMVWAALTPRGTQHFVSENYPRDFVVEEDHYETIDNVQPVLINAGYGTYSPYRKGPLPSFDNYTDYDYEDPTPLIRSSKTHLDEDVDRASTTGGDYPHYATLENTDMRCASLRRGGGGYPSPRPRVSSPTQIEHPNLPPLNLYNTYHHPSARKTATLTRNYKNAMDKYAC